jgi:threonine dehydrogenase-like Zn-dependent dehydrogenase
MWGHSPAGVYGYSHLLGGYAGGQAEYARVPFADVNPIKIENGFTDEQVLFLSDIFPTGYMAAEACGIEPGDTVAVWGCGPVGQFAIKSAFLLGADRAIGIDKVPERRNGVGAGCLRRIRRQDPVRVVMNRSITVKTGQTHVQRYMRPLLERIEKGEIDPSFVITHHMKLEDAPEGYEMFRGKKDECIKIVLKP